MNKYIERSILLLTVIVGCNSCTGLTGGEGQGLSSKRINGAMNNSANQEWRDICTFIGKIDGFSKLTEYTGQVRVVASDPNWVVELTVQDVIKGTPPVAQGQRVAYAIHSPTKLFAMIPEDAIGKQFELTVSELIESKDVWTITAKHLSNR